jgi:hypothetical protein
MTHKYAGVTLDWYDDQGQTLKVKFPSLDSLPEAIKTASVQPKEKLANEAFALIAVDEGHVLRKYACNDAGTTAMSVIYFMEHGHKLPDGAQKLAASNLVQACTEYGFLPPEQLTKTATSIGSDQPHIDITGQPAKLKIASNRPENDDDYAVVLQNGNRHYPIDTWDRVKTAESYFGENKFRMDPSIRRQYAVKLARKSFIMGYPLDGDIVELGSTDYASDGHIKAACAMRRAAVTEDHSREFLDEMIEKRAEIQPEVFAECLRRFDLDEGLYHGWDQDIPDPWASTLGIDKTAHNTVVWEQGAERVTEEALHNLVQNHIARLYDLYPKDMVLGMVKDPVGVFNSLPDPQKKLVARLANDSSSMGHGEFNPTKAEEGKAQAAGK